MKRIKFSNELTTLILSGKKTSTWRLFDDKDLKVGDELVLVNAETGEEFAQATIESLDEKCLKGLNEQDWEGHEKYESDEEMYEVFRNFYPSQKINGNTFVKIIRFKINNFLI